MSSTVEKVVVANPKSFALTQNREYPVISKSDRKITIVNDNNITASYYSSIFKDIVTAPKKKEPQAVVLPTVDEIIATFAYNLAANTISFSVQGTEHTIPYNLGNSGTSVSCGVRQISGLNEFFDVCTEYFEDNIDVLPVDLRNQVIDAMFGGSILAVMTNTTEVAMFILSTNTNYDEFSRIDAVLSIFSVADYTRNNPNSGNDIKLWVLNQQVGD